MSESPLDNGLGSHNIHSNGLIFDPPVGQDDVVLNAQILQQMKMAVSHHPTANPTAVKADLGLNESPGLVLVDEDKPHKPTKQRQWIFQSLRLFLGMAILSGGAWTVVQQQRTLTSQQGFINGSIVSIPAPIAGQLELIELKPGSPITQGQKLGQVANLRNPQLEIDRQRSQNKLDGLQVKFQSIQSKKSDRYSRLNQFQKDRAVQSRLSVTADNSRIDRIQAEIDQAQQSIEIAQREANRMIGLASSGAIAKIQADKAQDEVQSAQLRLAARQADLAQANTEQVAAKQGLQLDGAQNINYAETRSRELRDEIDDLDREAIQVTAEITQVNQELVTLNQQLKLQKFAKLEAPVGGVVWAIPNQVGNGKTVASSESLIQLLDCKQTWIDTFVSERELSHLKVGDTVGIKMLGLPDQQFTGRIQGIRAGVGRISPGTDVAVPPPQQSQRQVGVQISWQGNPAVTHQAAQFCGVGQGVEVVFQKQPLAKR
jgi:multidrug resistance efflux pump